MSNPRFVPRRYSNPQILFGRFVRIGWMRDDGSAELSDRIAAARMQHLFAYVIRMKIEQQFKSLKSYSEVAGVSPDRLGKVLRGELIMRIEDIAQADRILGQVNKEALTLV